MLRNLRGEPVSAHCGLSASGVEREDVRPLPATSTLGRENRCREDSVRCVQSIDQRRRRPCLGFDAGRNRLGISTSRIRRRKPTLYPRRHQNHYGKGEVGHIVRYWISIRARARELLPNAIPGEDYAITEVVHCKSRGEEGVAEAADECISRHFDNVMSVAAAPVVVALGAFAWKRFLDGLSPPKGPIDLDLGGQRRTVVFLPHPSSFVGPKSLAKRYTAEDMAGLRRLVAPRQGPPERPFALMIAANVCSRSILWARTPVQAYVVIAAGGRRANG